LGRVHLDLVGGTLDRGRAVRGVPAQQARDRGKGEVPRGQEVGKQAKGASCRRYFYPIQI